MASADHDPRPSDQGSSPDQGHCFLILDKTLITLTLVTWFK